jgi:hypothetical protein
LLSGLLARFVQITLVCAFTTIQLTVKKHAC